MNRRSGISCKVYHGDAFLGEAEAFPASGGKNQPFPFQGAGNELRITHLSPHSDRCPPLAILQAISPFAVRWKLLSKSITDYPALHNLYLNCFQEFKSAVVAVGKEELHLVAMPSKVETVSCFWCYLVQPGLYNNCLGMLNLRCLAIVFDLDETLIVANTMKSFEDRIEALSRKIDGEEDPVRVSGMSAELKRYIEDKDLLKQYIETDTISYNGKLVTVQNEEVLQLPGSHERVVRPVIRLQEKNIVLTRINPEIRDTSVFVRLRPAWEDLRSYLTAKGRKRFEVYVCTMAERDYALEMWRLLDPEAHLISSIQLVDRIVCVKSGLKKSLHNVFQGGVCHPKMALVIDDRLQVWEDKDQHRVHVVPAFTPYYAPHAEMSCAVPVLCVARNVACNIRGGFFKEFDENLLQKVYEVNYENEISDLPFPPDVGDYLISEDINAGQNNNRDIPMADGITGAEAEPKMNPKENSEDELKAQPQSHFSRSYNDDEPAAKQHAGSNKSLITELGLPYMPASSLSVPVLLEIGRICDSKVEFRSSNGLSKDFHFTIEVLFGTEKIGIGMGKTMKDAQQHAAENALRNLASNYVSFVGHLTESKDKKNCSPPNGNENGFLTEIVSSESVKKEESHASSTLEQSSNSNYLERLPSVLSGINELCLEGQSVVFRDKAPSSLSLNKGEYCYQVELAGYVLGEGVGLSEEEAKFKAAEVALHTLRTDTNSKAQKRPISTSS